MAKVRDPIETPEEAKERRRRARAIVEAMDAAGERTSLYYRLVGESVR